MGFATELNHQKFDRAIEHCQEAIRIASAVDAKPIFGSAHLTMGLVHEVVLGRLEEGREDTWEAIVISRAANDIPTYVQGVFGRAPA